MPHREQGGPDSNIEMKMRLMAARPVSLEGGEDGTEFNPGPDEADPLSSGGARSSREEALVKAYRKIKDEHGEWPKPEAGYEPRSMRGRRCEGCVFYQGDSQQGACDLVEGPVNAEGVCDLYVKQE
jgi:hypothetical protein